MLSIVVLAAARAASREAMRSSSLRMWDLDEGLWDLSTLPVPELQPSGLKRSPLSLIYTSPHAIDSQPVTSPAASALDLTLVEIELVVHIPRPLDDYLNFLRTTLLAREGGGSPVTLISAPFPARLRSSRRRSLLCQRRRVEGLNMNSGSVRHGVACLPVESVSLVTEAWPRGRGKEVGVGVPDLWKRDLRGGTQLWGTTYNSPKQLVRPEGVQGGPLS